MTLLKKKKDQILQSTNTLENLMKDIFCGMILIIYLFFSTVNPYLIAGRTK